MPCGRSPVGYSCGGRRTSPAAPCSARALEPGNHQHLCQNRLRHGNKKSNRVQDGERGTGDAGVVDRRGAAPSFANTHTPLLSAPPPHPGTRPPLAAHPSEEEPVGFSPDMPTTAEPCSSEMDRELSPVVVTGATASMGEESGPDRAATPPVWGLGGSGGDSSQPAPGPSPGTAPGISEDFRLPRRRPPPGKQVPCSSPGCFLSFPSVRDLAQHLRTHCPPTQSLEGRLFRCSAPSCTETFPSMHELMAHSKLHYKPNRYFKCENCLLRFRTHRSLFKHLHVCAEHAQSPAPPPPPALDKEPPAPERPPEADPVSGPGLQLPMLEPFTNPAPTPTGPFLPYLNTAPFGISPPRLRPFLATTPGPPASSAAVWKKSQGTGGSPRRPQGSAEAPSGHAATSRIVWEHTRGRYSCMQCAFSTASRPAMTLHLEDHRPHGPTAPVAGPPCPDGRADPVPLVPNVLPSPPPPPPPSEGERPVFLPL
ncbi:PREDICTED: zinc finger protein 414 [Chrysochloris asiatica]|uniref:Zinc finger protein 414 n=1 Tax=Chrysochloris asiatica TaxID=185453 RepID=A0A9B0TS48_CHRAS|nr:PREDICTED: zinc finger protein 414 [Chrysochloris asiatica]